MSDGGYSDYARAVIASYDARTETERNLLFDAVKDFKITRVLDLGCGPGQELLPFIENTDAVCIGVDIGEDLGMIAVPFFREKGHGSRANFVRGGGERLPFANESLDVVLCRVALPYMNNRQTIAEVARILKSGATFLLKTHAPPFYFAMFAGRLKNMNPKQLAYPALCLLASAWHSVTGRQLNGGIWRGKEIFQTRAFLEKELAKHGLHIAGELADTNRQTPSFRIVKA